MRRWISKATGYRACPCGQPDSVLAERTTQLEKFPLEAFEAGTFESRYLPPGQTWDFANVGVLEDGSIAPITNGEDLHAPCSHCGEVRKFRAVRGVFNSKKKCNAKCLNAKGFSCECSCGGLNHGAGLEAEPVLVENASQWNRDILPGGLADAGPPADLDPRQLRMGIEVELEHTNDRRIAREIALDHLTEDPKYYTHLAEMERKYQRNPKSDEKVYQEWKRLVNMSAAELRDFMASDYGKRAGLSKEKAAKLGIGRGWDSAKAILRMKAKPKSQWTGEDWNWARRQVSFIKRMKGNKGPLETPRGEPTRKLLSLLIWGHNPL